MLKTTAVEALADNYVWLIHGPADPASVAIVDPGDATPVLEALAQHNLTARAILITHHHWDHTNGIAGVLRKFDVPVYAAAHGNVAGRTHGVEHGDQIELADLGCRFDVMGVPGHTLDHLAYYGHDCVFPGDTLFSAGCGRMFEGQPAQMLESLNRLRDLPDHTQLYCGHEYTLANLRFARAVEPHNEAIDDYFGYASRLRGQGAPTLPSNIGLERTVNPFLRCDNESVHKAASRKAGAQLPAPSDVFATLRGWKDTF